MAPHLVKWHEKYSSQSFTAIEIINGLIDPLGRVQEHARSSRLPFPVYHDADAFACTLYNVESYPTYYLIGRDGKVVWEGHGFAQGDLPAIEREIQKAVGK